MKKIYLPLHTTLLPHYLQAMEPTTYQTLIEPIGEVITTEIEIIPAQHLATTEHQLTMPQRSLSAFF